MPRTKKIQAKRVESTRDSKESKKKDLVLKLIDEEEKREIGLIEAQMKNQLDELDEFYLQAKAKWSLTLLSRTIREIQSGDIDSTFNSTKSSKKTNQTLCNSRTLSKRSVSLGCGDDEGYTTAESTRGTTSGNRTTRLSRSRTKTVQAATSRSLSRNTTKKATGFRTPVNKKPPLNDVGTITPKYKPNTPQIFVRRAKVGEMAWSNQGSPLLTSHTVSAEQIANVNIPLPDGNLVSLLPQRGVRLSQMPEVDADTRRQLEILRDNLMKVCSGFKDKV